MDRIVAECFKNPVKLEIYMRVKLMGRATAQQLLQQGVQIPPATLYRNLSKLLSDGILRVAEEHKVRGINEKVYAIAVEVGDEEIQEQSDEADEKFLLNRVAAAMSEIFKGFASVKSGTHKNKMPNSLIYGSVYATEDEMQAALGEIEQIIGKLRNNEATCNRKKRSIGFMVTPVSEKQPL